MLDYFLGTAQGVDQPAGGSVQLAELLADQLVVCLAAAVCKHKHAQTTFRIECKCVHSLYSTLHLSLPQGLRGN